MKNWFANLIHPRQEPVTPGSQQAFNEHTPSTDAASSTSSVMLALQTEVQALRMEIEAREGSIANLKQEIERLRLRQEQVIAETVSSRLTGLFTELAAPSSQILTQADLLDHQGKPVQARDVLAVARRMIRALERAGVVFVGQVGEQVAFDPNWHAPISSAATPQPGQPVIVRFAGVVYEGKMMYKAVVE